MLFISYFWTKLLMVLFWGSSLLVLAWWHAMSRYHKVLWGFPSALCQERKITFLKRNQEETDDVSEEQKKFIDGQKRKKEKIYYSRFIVSMEVELFYIVLALSIFFHICFLRVMLGFHGPYSICLLLHLFLGKYPLSLSMGSLATSTNLFLHSRPRRGPEK